VVLKRYADAVRDGNNILAVVRGSAMNNDGTGTSFGTPNPIAQELVIRKALENSGVKPSEVSFIEAHGTGTVVGGKSEMISFLIVLKNSNNFRNYIYEFFLFHLDPIEVNTLGKVYSEGRTSPVWLSSVKSNMGHAEPAAGIAGMYPPLISYSGHFVNVIIY